MRETAPLITGAIVMLSVVLYFVIKPKNGGD